MMRFFLTVMAAMTLPLEYMLPPSVYVIQRACITVNLPVIISCCCHRKSTTRKLGERKHTHTHMLTFLGVFSFSAGRTRDH
jgi:hypothetical protein